MESQQVVSVDPMAMLESARARAADEGLALSVAVVDQGANLVGFLRMEGAPLVSIKTSQRKAYAAAAIGMPPDDFYSAISSDEAATASFVSRDELALIAGGIPIIRDGRLVGGIGVAGAMTAGDDRRIAEHAAAEL